MSAIIERKRGDCDACGKPAEWSPTYQRFMCSFCFARANGDLLPKNFTTGPRHNVVAMPREEGT